MLPLALVHQQILIKKLDIHERIAKMYRARSNRSASPRQKKLGKKNIEQGIYL